MPAILINEKEAILFKSPKPKSINPYSKDKFHLATDECCMFDVMDCVFEAKEQKEYKTDVVRKAIHTFSEEYRQVVIALAENSKQVKNQSLYPLDKILPLLKISCKTLVGVDNYLSAATRWFAHASPELIEGQKSYASWAMLFAGFWENGAKIAILNSAAMKVLVDLNLYDQQEYDLFKQKLEKSFARKLDLLEELSLPLSLLQDKFLQSVGFKSDFNWDPTQGIEVFVSQLKQRGILVVSGFFQQDFFNKPPLPIQLGTQTVYATAQGEIDKEKVGYGHIIAVIGAVKKTHNGADASLVYYIDPGRDVGVDTYPIYVMSYQWFCYLSTTIRGERIDKTNILLDKASGKQYSYFLYHPDKAPQQQLLVKKDCMSKTMGFWSKHNKTISITVGVAAMAVGAFSYLNR